MNCAECKELLVGYVEGFLDEPQKRAVAEHLRECPSCHEQVQQIEGLRERLVTNGKALAGSNLENEVMNRIIRQQKIQLEAQGGLSKAPNIWRIIMKSRITKLAIAAAIIIAALIGLHSIGGNPLGATVTFAQVIEPILNAKTVILDMFIGGDETGTMMHEIVSGSRIRRTFSNMPNLVQVIDTDSGQMLALDTESNTASYIDIEGYIKDATKNYVKFLRDVITDMKDNFQELGEQIIDGRKTIAFQAAGPNEGVKIWADAQTGHPLRIELRIGQMYAVLKNFEFDTYIADALVSMDVPDGYTLKKTDIDMRNATEEDFIESLSIWAEILGDGVFPEEIGTEVTMKKMPALIEKLKAMNISEEEGTQMGMKVGLGMMFYQMVDMGGCKWQYTGDGVQYGDAEKVVFRYQPKGSETWRVIYGDLSVEDVEPEDLPK
jgi:hypothetical protein